MKDSNQTRMMRRSKSVEHAIQFPTTWIATWKSILLVTQLDGLGSPSDGLGAHRAVGLWCAGPRQSATQCRRADLPTVAGIAFLR